jgi:crotonobetaine/carnitine-CoA ligase
MDMGADVAIPARLAQRALAAERPAIHWVEDGTQTSYAQLDEQATRWSALLRRRGVLGEDRVVIMSTSGPDFVGAYLGCLRSGAVAAPLSAELRGDSLEGPLRLYRPKVVIVDADLVPLVAAATTHWRDPLQCLVLDGSHHADLAKDLAKEGVDTASPRAADPAMIMATSGTTGPSKGSLWTHGTITHWARTFAHHLRYVEDDRIYCCTPLNHANALVAGLCTAIEAGASIAMARRFSLSRFWADIEGSRSTSANILGAMIRLLLESAPGPVQPPSSLRTLLVSACSANDYRRIRTEWGLFPVTAYGLTDFGQLALGMANEPAPPGSSGRVTNGYEIKLVDQNQREVEIGEVGEAVVRPTLPDITPLGYFGMPEESLQSRRDLWFHTGDLLRRDADGWFYFAGRIKEAMRYRGENVSAFEVESALLQCEGVKEAAVYPVPADLGEDEIVAALVLRDNAPPDPESIITAISDHLPYYAVPRFIRVLDDLPRNQSHRVKKADLIDEGVTAGTWDRLAAGVIVERNQTRR